MAKLLIIDNFHHTNQKGLQQILTFLKIEHKFGNINDINNYNIIYSPTAPINTSIYPNKKFIFGPHFSVFPDNKLKIINNIHNNSIYIQPSKWVVDLWTGMNILNYLPIKVFSFPVDTDRFCENNNLEKNEVLVYFKRRKPEELKKILNLLNNNKINYRLFDYVKQYNENDYLTFLQKCKYGIILDAHESQGFAIEEALTCNVPLLVWNVRYMSQEYGSSYNNIPCTSISYWDERCGEYFFEEADLEKTFNNFISKIETYKPREYILENLSVEKCSKEFFNLII